jgi:DNA-binding NarL/FixJ family response regulator
MPRIRLLHCDDSAPFTRLVRHWLAEHDDIEHLGAAHTGTEALQLLSTQQPDVILLDTMGSPGDDSLLGAIRRAAPDARVIVYSGYLSILDADQLGGDADAYLEKAEDDRALVAMIRAVGARA